MARDGRVMPLESALDPAIDEITVGGTTLEALFARIGSALHLAIHCFRQRGAVQIRAAAISVGGVHGHPRRGVGVTQLV